MTEYIVDYVCYVYLAKATPALCEDIRDRPLRRVLRPCRRGRVSHGHVHEEAQKH